MVVTYYQINVQLPRFFVRMNNLPFGSWGSKIGCVMTVVELSEMLAGERFKIIDASNVLKMSIVSHCRGEVECHGHTPSRRKGANEVRAH